MNNYVHYISNDRFFIDHVHFNPKNPSIFVNNGLPNIN